MIDEPESVADVLARIIALPFRLILWFVAAILNSMRFVAGLAALIICLLFIRFVLEVAGVFL